MTMNDAPQVEMRSRAELRTWLEQNHGSSRPVWAIVYKRHHPYHLAWVDLVQELLCFGWIDSLRRSLDADRSLQYISPRKPGSNWSPINKRHVEELEAAGLMTEAGREKVREAQQDGSWTAYDEVDQLVMPPDLAALLDKDHRARATFDAYPATVKKAFLWWIKSAKTDATRRKRLDGTLRAAQQGIRVPRQASAGSGG